MTSPAAATSPYRSPAAVGARDLDVPFARSLEEANLGEVVNLNTMTGEVRPVSRTKNAIVLGIMPGIGVALFLGYSVVANLVGRFQWDQMMGGIVLGGVFVAIGLWMRKSTLAVLNAGALVNVGKLDEAEAILRTWSGLRAMGTGDLYLGTVLSLRGDDEGALARYWSVAAFYGSLGQGSLGGIKPLEAAVARGDFGPRPANSQFLVGYLEAAYQAARALCNLGRVEEAEGVLAIAGRPVGEYTALLFAVSSLYAQLCAGKCTVTDEEVRALRDLGGRLQGTWGLLGLCAWACAQRGDEASQALRGATLASSADLVRAELERPSSRRLQVLMPQLYAWLESARK
jgi:hypothetical protein